MSRVDTGDVEWLVGMQARVGRRRWRLIAIYPACKIGDQTLGERHIWYDVKGYGRKCIDPSGLMPDLTDPATNRIVAWHRMCRWHASNWRKFVVLNAWCSTCEDSEAQLVSAVATLCGEPKGEALAKVFGRKNRKPAETIVKLANKMLKEWLDV